jgi:hypothetical protein
MSVKSKGEQRQTPERIFLCHFGTLVTGWGRAERRLAREWRMSRGDLNYNGAALALSGGRRSKESSLLFPIEPLRGGGGFLSAMPLPRLRRLVSSKLTIKLPD